MEPLFTRSEPVAHPSKISGKNKSAIIFFINNDTIVVRLLPSVKYFPIIVINKCLFKL